MFAWGGLRHQSQVLLGRLALGSFHFRAKTNPVACSENLNSGMDISWRGRMHSLRL